MIRRRMVDWIVYFLIRVVICVTQAMSLERCRQLARGLAWVACDVIRLRFEVVDSNLQHAFPALTAAQRRRCARAMWEHLFLMVAEVAQVRRKVHVASYHRYVDFRNKRLLVKYLLDSRPTVLVTGHFGNFEAAGYILGLFGFPSYTIARRLDNPFLNEFINRFRSSTGQFILPKNGCAPQVAKVLEQGGTLSLLGDQHAGPKGCWVDFLGRPASCHKAVALFTLSSGAPQLVAYVRRRRQPMSFEVGVTDVADPKTWDPELAGVKPLTRWYNQQLEAVIRQTPEQYWWVHRRWKGQRPVRRRSDATPSSATRAA